MIWVWCDRKKGTERIELYLRCATSIFQNEGGKVRSGKGRVIFRRKGVWEFGAGCCSINVDGGSWMDGRLACSGELTVRDFDEGKWG